MVNVLFYNVINVFINVLFAGEVALWIRHRTVEYKVRFPTERTVGTPFVE